GSGLAAFAGTLFFSLHPVHTEALNVISYRGLLLSGMFTFLSLFVFLSTKRPFARFILIPVLFLLALASKESSAAIPLVLAAASIYTGEISAKKGLAENLKSSLFLLPMFSLLVLYFFLRSYVLTGETQSFFEGLAPSGGILMVFKIFYQYMRLIFLPYPLSPFYDWSVIGIPSSLSDYEVIIGLIFISASIFSFFYFLRRMPLFSFAILIFFIELLPVSHIMPFIVPFAERFLYIPLIGIAVILSFLIGAMLKRGMKTGAAIIAALLILPASGVSFVRNGEWKSTISILEANVRDFPNSFNAHFSLGKLLMDSDRRRSEEHLKTAIRIMPGVPVTYALLAADYILEGRHEEAGELLEKAPEKEIVMIILNDELAKRR
ncbi:MAG: tetratricopeptide repeat protein, partial [Deltaproteobacteria bacterium]|nr:tetratricopeptide repeat protein [Deltaproteobacteria bacterium]